MQKRNNQKKYNYNSYTNYYNKTSEAFDYNIDYGVPANTPTPKKRIKKIAKTKYVAVEKNIKIFSFKFFVTLILLFSFSACTIFLNASIIQKRFEIDDLKVELKELKENNKFLETEIAKNLDLEYIENFAATKLDMQKPSNHQIVHINVPKESYTVKSDLSNKENYKKSSFWKLLKK